MFEVKIAVKLAKICEATYLGSDEEMRKWLTIDNPIKLKTAGDQLVTIINEDSNDIVAFRGIVTLGAWIDDIEFVLHKFSDFPGKVHYGFMKALEGLVDWILSNLDRIKPIQLTGHSLGGALATLMVIKLRNQNFNLLPIYTFGSPKVGDATFARQFPGRHYRVVNDFDPVPHIPFKRYIHTGTEIRLPEGDTPNSWRLIRSLLTHIKYGPGPMTIQSIKDHFIKEYIRALIKLPKY